MTGVQSFDLRDLHVFEERAAPDQFAAQERTVGGVRIDGFSAPRAAAETDQDHVRTPKGRFSPGLLEECIGAGHRPAGRQQAAPGENTFQEREVPAY